MSLSSNLFARKQEKKKDDEAQESEAVQRRQPDGEIHADCSLRSLHPERRHNRSVSGSDRVSKEEPP